MPHQLIWLIFLLPLFSFVTISFFIRPFVKTESKVAGYVLITALSGSLALSIWALVAVTAMPHHELPVPDVNWVMIEDALLQAGGPSQAEHYPMPVESDDLARAATAYAKTLALIAGDPVVIDLVHLGLGDDGHTASLVPGDEALMMTDRDVAVTALYRGHRRMTLTFPALNRARERLWLATGADKVTMLARLRDGDHRIPAGRVSGDNTIIFTDVRPDHETVSPD